MLAILAFEVTVYRHQEYYRGRNNLTAPVSKTIFHDITRHHLDDGIINCAKYFINYFFYKFGLEVSFLAGVFSIFCDNLNSCFWPVGHKSFILHFQAMITDPRDQQEKMLLKALPGLAEIFPAPRANGPLATGNSASLGLCRPTDTWMPVTCHCNWFLINRKCCDFFFFFCFLHLEM